MVNMSPILLIAIPLGLSFLVPLLKKGAKYIPPIAMLFNLILSILLVPQVMRKPIIVLLGSGWPPPFCINLVVSSFGILLTLLISLVGFLISIYAIVYIKKGATEKYHTLYLLLLTGATGIVLTGDIFNLFVFFEILCISSYALVAYNGDKTGIESGIKYLVQGTVGSSLILIGIALLYGNFGTLNMAHIAQNIHSISEMYLFLPLVLLITGFGVEAAMFPLNAWLPDAHSSAPSSISAILSGIAIKMGVYAIIRVVFTIFNASGIFLFLTFMGLLTLLISELVAFRQDNIKRMLAYSSTGQIGLIIFAFGIASTTGVQGALFQVTSHALSKVLLFLAAGYMIYRTGSMDISSMEGMGRRMPLTSFAFTIGAFSIIGFPPFIGFPSKFLVVKAALAKQELLFTIFIGFVLLGTIIEGAYFLKVIQRIYFKGGKESNNLRQEAPVVALIPIFILVLLIVVLGVYPNFISNILNSAAGDILNRTGYINSVLP